ncbi:MAG: hypothetical protein JWM80_4837 [Cyanobacteria bacterium RYN_339]|nr:hypothetical protein [Cyanobacteria bacterium RYN_339]
MIKVRQLTKHFRVHTKEPGLKGSIQSLFRRQWLDKVALDDVSLDVGPGEILGLIGSNGAGKTTLVKTLTGILHPTSGTVEVLGRVPWERSDDFRRQIALIMGQKAQLWWDLPASDCFLLLREIYQIPKAQFVETLDYLVEHLQVRDQLNIQIRRLSLGERMKMELIAALLHRPKVVYLDEPTIGLDLGAQRAIREFLLQYRAEHQPAMILTSHYMEDIQSLCKRIVIMTQGRVVYDGSLERVVNDYATHRVILAGLKGDPGTVAFHPELGEVVAATPEQIRVRVPRAKTADAASFLLAHYPVADITIEEEDISAIIEKLQRKPVA